MSSSSSADVSSYSLPFSNDARVCSLGTVGASSMIWVTWSRTGNHDLVLVKVVTDDLFEANSVPKSVRGARSSKKSASPPSGTSSDDPEVSSVNIVITSHDSVVDRARVVERS